MAPPVSQIAYDLLVITCLIASIPVMIWVTLESPIIPRTTPSFIVAAITAVATLFTSVVKGRVQHGFMRNLEAPLRNIGNEPENEQLFQRRLLDAGTQVINYEPLIPGAVYPYTENGTSDACAGVMQKNFRVEGAFGWKMTNDSGFFSSWLRDCPASRVMSHAYNINNQNPEEYAYVDAGVAVHHTAMGASAHLFRGTTFQKLNERYGRFLRSTTQCVPVMTKNPFTCNKGGGRLERVPDTERELRWTGDGDLRNLSRQAGFARYLNRSSVMLNYMWAEALSGIIGKSIVLFSAYNDPKAETRFAWDLARTINDTDKDAGTKDSETYVVFCDVNPQDSFEYRLVTLNLQAASDSSNNTSPAYSRLLKGGAPCTPTNRTISNLHFVAAGTSAYKMVMEGYGLDGYFATVHRIAGADRPPPYAFNNSRNGLEDTLGVISAIAVSTMDLFDDAVVADALEGQGGKAEATIDVRRLGGNKYVLIFIIPSIFSLFTLLYFLMASFRSACQLGGGVTHENRPKRYAAESIRELITLGQPQERIQLVEQQPLIRLHGS